ncbi:Fimbrial assembly protein, partial [human gut metagenome]
MECHGTVKADKGVYTFHMDGSKREHNVSGRENINGPSVGGCSLAFLCMGISISKTKIIA